MTSGIPTYSETETISRAWATEPERDFSLAELVTTAYPTGTNDLPIPTGYFYSNTDYILAGMIAEKATGQSYRDLVHERIIKPFGLTSTFYETSLYPDSVMSRLSRGYFESPECAAYQPPDCKQSWNLPIVGKDMRDMSLSWAQSAGGAISNARDIDRWVRAIFGGKVVPPKQQEEWLRLVSQKTGDPIADVTADDAFGYALGLGKGFFGPLGAVWFYQGETLGYRTPLRLVSRRGPHDHGPDQQPPRRGDQQARRRDHRDTRHRREAGGEVRRGDRVGRRGGRAAV